MLLYERKTEELKEKLEIFRATEYDYYFNKQLGFSKCVAANVFMTD